MSESEYTLSDHSSVAQSSSKRDDPFAILSLPYGTRPDPDEYLRSAMAWHFGTATGSPFWLARAATLGFDPISEIRSYTDLARFPNLTDELRDVPLGDLIPRGYGTRPDIISVVESGGTTGAPKSLPLFSDFATVMADRESAVLRRHGLSPDRGWLAVVPSGPHGGYEQCKRTARVFGTHVFGVDFDPRWVKKQIGVGRIAESEDYVEHILDQAAMILQRQRIGLLRTTPPLLARMTRRDDLVNAIRDSVDYIHWGGASMDLDTRYLLQNEVFPQASIVGAYGTTMALGSGGVERPDSSDPDLCVFDPGPSPQTVIKIVDPDSGRTVRSGERGQIVVDFVTRGLFIPNNLERDEATRIEPADKDQLGDSFANVSPLREFAGVEVVEGVY